MRHSKLTPGDLPAPTQDRTEWKGSLKLITPLYKGGANPDIADENQAFRGPSIRGQLRYWWRATSSLTDVERLRHAEQMLFGGVFGTGGIASQIRVGVIEQKSEVTTCGIAFPDALYLLWVQRNPANRAFHKTASGRFLLSGPSAQQEEIQKALLAWILCGGLGSRSRRGLGGVWLESAPSFPLPGKGFANKEAFLKVLKTLVPKGGKRPWPTLAGGQVITAPVAHDALSALRTLATTMQNIRTYRNKNRPVVFDKTWQSVRLAKADDLGFTAALGMPVPYQSSGGHFERQRTLQPVCKGRRVDRYPSPILFRAIPLENGKFLPVLIVLNTPSPQGVEIGQVRGLIGQFRSEGLQTFIDALPNDWQRTPLDAP